MNADQEVEVAEIPLVDMFEDTAKYIHVVDDAPTTKMSLRDTEFLSEVCK